MLIASYRREYAINHSCSCHPEYHRGDSDFELRPADSIEEAAKYIGQRLMESTHSRHSHVILTNDGWNASYYSADPEGLNIRGDKDRYGKTYTQTVPGNIYWPVAEEADEETLTMNEKNATELHNLVVQHVEKASDQIVSAYNAKVQKEAETRAKKELAEKEATFERLKSELKK